MIPRKVVILKGGMVTRRAENLISWRKMPYRTPANHMNLDIESQRVFFKINIIMLIKTFCYLTNNINDFEIF